MSVRAYTHTLISDAQTHTHTHTHTDTHTHIHRHTHGPQKPIKCLQDQSVFSCQDRQFITTLYMVSLLCLNHEQTILQ